MKIISTALLITLLLLDSNPENSVLISKVNYEDGQYLFEDRPLTGKIIDYYENEVLKFRYAVLEGALHGSATEYYPDGAVKSERNYTFNKLYGEFTEYFPNGEIKAQFEVGRNSYQKGEAATNIKIAKGKRRKLKDQGSATLIFTNNEGKALSSSEYLSLIEQKSFQLINEKGRVIFEN